MDRCDICGEVIQGDLQVVENERVQLAAAALGALDKTMGEFAEKLGMPREQLAITWSKRQEDTNMPWNLCPGCALRIERLAYTAETAIKEKQQKKFWQFWKR